MPHLPDPNFPYAKDVGKMRGIMDAHSVYETPTRIPSRDNSVGCDPPCTLPPIDSVITYWSYDIYRHWYCCRTLWRGYESTTRISADNIDLVRPPAVEYIWHHVVSCFLKHIREIFEGKVPDVQE